MKLEVIDTQGRRIVELQTADGEIYRIGRREGNDLQLPGSEVSRDHAEIARRGDDWVLVDRGSRYGTFVNGEQVTGFRRGKRAGQPICRRHGFGHFAGACLPDASEHLGVGLFAES